MQGNGKTWKHSKSQKMQIYKGAKHANMQRQKNLQTFKVVKDANILSRKRCKHT